MGDNEYSVFQWFADDSCERVESYVSAERAMLCAHRLTRSVGGRLGMIARIIITDGEDFCVFEWLKDKGVVFPPECVRPEQINDDPSQT